MMVLPADLLGDAVRCDSCGHSYCLFCDKGDHAPVSCTMVANWVKRGGVLAVMPGENKEEEEAKQLMAKLTKPCPKCGVRIEKNGGCPHMTCKRVSEGWVGPDSSHDSACALLS